MGVKPYAAGYLVYLITLIVLPAPDSAYQDHQIMGTAPMCVYLYCIYRPKCAPHGNPRSQKRTPQRSLQRNNKGPFGVCWEYSSGWQFYDVLAFLHLVGVQ